MQKIKMLLEKINNFTRKVEVFILSTSVITMTLLTISNALGRYLFGKSLFFGEEVNRFLIVSITFMGLAYAVRFGRNIRMTAIYDILPLKQQKYLTMFIAIMTSLLMFVLAYQALEYVLTLKELNRLSPALQVPVYMVFSVIPLGFTMAGIQFLVRFVQNVFNEEIYLSYDVIEEKDKQEMIS